MIKKKGVSPVIATVLLISMVIIIGIIVFLWFRGMIGETVTKFGENIELACEDVVFDASYSSGILYIVNNGNIPIYDFNVKFEGAGSRDTSRMSEISTWKSELGESRLAQGKSYSGSINDGGADKIVLIPILLGSTDKGETAEFVCDENSGNKIII